MSLLVFAHAEDQAFVLTDTLATDGSGGAPLMFLDKCIPFPSIDLLVATTGYSELLFRWVEVIRKQVRVRDVVMLDEHTPAALRSIWSDLEEEHGPMSGTATIYHFGIEERTGRCERYAYRSANDFVSERAEDGGFGVKPPPADPKVMEEVEALDDWVGLAERIRTEQDALPADERVSIGGDLVLTHLQRNNIQTTRIHRFRDQYDHWQVMNGGEPFNIEASLSDFL